MDILKMVHIGIMAVVNSHETSKYDRLVQWRNGETPGPWTISFYPTYRCNIECRICWKRQFEEPLTAKEELPSERLLEMVDEAAEMGVREWIIGGGGELMLRSNAVIAMLEKIRSRHMNGMIQTNGTRWTEEHLQALVDMQWHSVTVSLDGPTREINDAVRIEENFDRSIETIRRLQEIKRERNSQFPLINLTTVVTNANFRHLEGMVDLSEELGLTPGTVSAVDLIVYGDHDRKYLLNAEERVELIERLEKVIDYADGKGVAHEYRNYLAAAREVGSVKAIDLFGGADTRVSEKTMCFEPFLHMVIMPQGLTGPCCTFEDDTADNVWSSPMQEVWLGSYMTKVRGQLLEGKPPGYCTECIITRIQENRNIQTRSRPVTVIQFLNKAGSSLKRHGLRASIRRGQEWRRVRKGSRDLTV